jgi:hypothetical protein
MRNRYIIRGKAKTRALEVTGKATLVGTLPALFWYVNKNQPSIFLYSILAVGSFPYSHEIPFFFKESRDSALCLQTIAYESCIELV